MTIHDPSLRAALKTLKLTGMLDTLDARLAQTRDGKLGHLEFLQVLCEDEIARRETAALARRVRRARFEQHNTFEDFDFTVSPKLPAAMLRDLAALRWLDAGESVILYGPVGVGKTHVAQALGHQVARRGGDIRFVKCSRMLADLAGGHADRTIGQRMREYTRPLVLIVDDFAMREHTPTQSDDLYDLVSDRAIAAKPLILTSNRAPKDWYPLFPNPVVAESLKCPRFCSDSYRRIRSMPRQYSPEFRQRALRLLDTMMEASDISEFEAIKSVASKLGISEESVRRWRRKAQVDAGERPGTTSSEHAEIRKLKREVSELRRANEILKSASAFFAAELDRPASK